VDWRCLRDGQEVQTHNKYTHTHTHTYTHIHTITDYKLKETAEETAEETEEEQEQEEEKEEMNLFQEIKSLDVYVLFQNLSIGKDRKNHPSYERTCLLVCSFSKS
jgi:hypothetical protein